MKVVQAFACEKILKNVGTTLKKSFKTVMANPSQKKLKFGIAIFLHVDPDGDQGLIEVSLISPDNQLSPALFQRNMTIPAGVDRPVPIGVDVDLPAEAETGQYRCLVRINGEEVFNEPLFLLASSEGTLESPDSDSLDLGTPDSPEDLPPENAAA